MSRRDWGNHPPAHTQSPHAQSPLRSLPPSTEYYLHRSIYQRQPSAKAVVHAHSTYATALSCTSLKKIPAFHYMMATVGGNTIDITPYKLFGTEDLANEMHKAFRSS